MKDDLISLLKQKVSRARYNFVDSRRHSFVESGSYARKRGGWKRIPAFIKLPWSAWTADPEPLERISSIFDIPGPSRAIRVFFLTSLSFDFVPLRLHAPAWDKSKERERERERAEATVDRQDCRIKKERKKEWGGRKRRRAASVINCF